jgi:hypothetical protein
MIRIMTNPREMTLKQQEILDAMCTHRLFTQSGRYPEMLRYLAEHSFPSTQENREARKGEVLRDKFYNGQPSGDTNVRRDIGYLRLKVKKYADTPEGRQQPEKLLIVEPGASDIYLVTFVRNVEAARELENFWGPHIQSDAVTTIVYTEPYFFHDESQRIWTRCLAINDETGKPPKFLPPGKFKPAYNYVPTGEVRSLLGISSWLGGKTVVVNYEVFHNNATYEDIPQSNLVLLGAPRCNPIMRLLQKGITRSFHYFMGDAWIDARNRKPSEKRPFEDSKMEGDDNGQLIHVLVTRLCHPADKRLWVTVITADHTRAAQKVCEVLTDNNQFKKLSITPDKLNREGCQLIFRAEVFGDETQVRSLELIETWTPAPPAKAAS